uniref:G-protein coupled receptors family 1 profile domain-containing protein n=1 Tax=Electrophorus electricus TaxID=8005 RepID=A0A4W4F468_ELEEL
MLDHLSRLVFSPNITTLSPETAHALITIYVVVLVAGSVGLALMIRVLKANLHSWTTIALLNLIFAHLIFLLTVPFRIYYYATGFWYLTMSFCKLVSAMIHIHMYIVFVIYAVILTVHFLQYYKKMEQMVFDRMLHAMAASAGMWSILIIVVPIILKNYGNTKQQAYSCFDFHNELENQFTFVLNVFLSVGMVLVSIVLSYVLAIILHSVVRKHGRAFRAHQEFWAQMKHVSLMLIILICLVPYQLFRLYYLRNAERLKEHNEVFLAFTTLTCFDMLLLFSGKGICQRCGV